MPTDVDATASHLARRTALRRAAADERAARFRSRLPDAVAALKRAGAHRVIVFGSFANGRYTELSDVDIAVDGLASDRYFAVLADLMALFESPVDLVVLEQAPKSLVDRIEVEGVEL
jgi:predicted nucleotidyltransferase